MPRTVFHLDLDAFFVAVERRLNPDLVGKPEIVSPGTARAAVAAASYEARRFGVHSAMPFAAAQRRCPQAVVCPGNFRAYQDYSRRFFAILADYSPQVEPASLDEGYLEYTGCEKLFGPALPAAEAVQRRVLAELGLEVSVGIASSKGVAKMASDLSKPAGLVRVLPGYEAAFLAPLPIGRLLGVGPKSEARLRALGIRHVGDLARLSRAHVSKAFGEGATGMHALARGRDDSPVARRERAKSVSHEETFVQDVTDPGTLHHALHRLVCETGYRLRRQGLRARTVFVKVRYADFTLRTRAKTLPEATDIDRVLVAAGRELLGRVLDRRVRLRLIGFGVQNLTAADAQPDLPALARRRREESLQVAADAVRARYGYDSVQWAALLRQRVD